MPQTFDFIALPKAVDMLATDEDGVNPYQAFLALECTRATLDVTHADTKALMASLTQNPDYNGDMMYIKNIPNHVMTPQHEEPGVMFMYRTSENMPGESKRQNVTLHVGWLPTNIFNSRFETMSFDEAAAISEALAYLGPQE